MSRLVLTPLDMNKNEVQNHRLHVLASAPSSPVTGQLYYNSSDNKLYYWNGSIWVGNPGSGGVASVTATGPLENTGTAADPVIALKTGSQAGASNGIANTHIASDAAIANSKLATNPLARANHTGTQAASTISDFDAQVRTSRLDQMAAPTAAVSLNSQRITSLADPTAAQDATSKAYVDAVAAGLAPKDAVRVATTVNGTLATAFENGDAIDGVTLATGDRILIKNQSAGAENGIYTVNASGAPTRATDADSSGDLIGASVFVSEGTTNGNTLWVMTTDGPITVGTTALVWSQFGGPGAVTAGTGITVTGQQVALTTPVSVANGGTNATTAAGARTSLGVPGKFAGDIGDGAATSYVVTHSLGTRDVVVSIHDNTTPFAEVIADVEKTSTTTITVRFAVAPTSNQYRVTVIG